jgi:phage terminase large subunit-like protein
MKRMHAGQQAIYDDPARFKVVCCGRRWGKSEFSRTALVLQAIQGKITAYFAPTDKALTKYWERMKALLAPLTIRKDEQKKILYLRGGGELWCWSLENYETVRGGDYDFVVVDECCAVKKFREAWTEVIRPTLIDRQGAALFLSTPKGFDFFYELFLRGDPTRKASLTTVAASAETSFPRDGECSKDGEIDEWAGWASFTAPSSGNPHLPPEEIVQIAKELPEGAYEQEILALFRSRDGAIFRNVLACATATPQEKAQDGHIYVGGIDWARTKDYTVFTVFDLTTGEAVCIDRYNQTDYETQKSRVKGVYERFRPVTILAETNSIGGPQIEDLQRAGLPISPFVTTNATKATVIDALVLAFEQSTIRIPDDPALKAQLIAFEATPLPSGLVRYAAPSGQHDDLVISLALAHYAAKRGGQPQSLPDLW